jgi:hypothetical protein
MFLKVDKKLRSGYHKDRSIFGPLQETTMRMPFSIPRHGLLTLLMVLCVALMGQSLFLEMHHHEPDHSGARHCWACAAGPVAAVVVSAVLLLPSTLVAAPPSQRPEAPSFCRVLRHRLRGPPVHS